MTSISWIRASSTDFELHQLTLSHIIWLELHLCELHQLTLLTLRSNSWLWAPSPDIQLQLGGVATPPFSRSKRGHHVDCVSASTDHHVDAATAHQVDCVSASTWTLSATPVWPPRRQCNSGEKDAVAPPPAGTRVSCFERSLLKPNSALEIYAAGNTVTSKVPTRATAITWQFIKNRFCLIKPPLPPPTPLWKG